MQTPAHPPADKGRCGDCCWMYKVPGNECCHRYPPTLEPREDKVYARYPDVHAWMWCGEWRAR